MDSFNLSPHGFELFWVGEALEVAGVLEIHVFAPAGRAGRNRRFSPKIYIVLAMSNRHMSIFLIFF